MGNGVTLTANSDNNPDVIRVAVHDVVAWHGGSGRGGGGCSRVVVGTGGGVVVAGASLQSLFPAVVAMQTSTATRLTRRGRGYQSIRRSEKLPLRKITYQLFSSAIVRQAASASASAASEAAVANGLRRTDGPAQVSRPAN